MRCPKCHHHHEDTPNCYKRSVRDVAEKAGFQPVSNDLNFMNVRFVVSEQVPKNSLFLISPRHNPVTGELDMDATAKASAVISNFKEG